jgi:hypothetical protein
LDPNKGLEMSERYNTGPLTILRTGPLTILRTGPLTILRTGPLTILRQNLPRLSIVLLALSGVLASQTARADHESDVDYLTDIKPLLRDKCFSCHGSLNTEGGLRLDAASLIRKGGDSGPSFVAGSVAKSLILERVTDDDDNRMPPAEDGSRLTAEEVAKLTTWITSGAAAPDELIPEHPSRHWSFLPPVKADVPNVSAEWIRSDIDRFLVAEHGRVGVNAVGETSRSMLLRRATLALTGLPPTPAERQAFLDDKSTEAFGNAVDRLLESPRYGERWGRHFMDIWRYSDPSGYGNEIRDGRQHIWRWRDWIVESLNADKGYDQMIVEMLAADEVSPEDQDELRATGYLARNWYKFNRNVWLDNVVEHSSKAFLGLTMNCARCHSHKYDPIEHYGYYRMRAIFETYDVRDDPLLSATLSGSTAPNGMLVRAFDAHLARQTFPFLQGDENRPDKDHPLPPGLPELLGELSVAPVQLPVTVWYPALRKENREAAMKIARAKIAPAEMAITSSRDTLEAAKKKLADFREPDPDTSQPDEKPESEAVAGRSLLSDDFSKLNLDQWKIESGEWSQKDGRVVQSDGVTKQYRLVSLVDHPRDFRAKVRLRITGGETYKSVGLGFDGHGLAMNAVYLSVSGPKLQFTSQESDARWQYPADAMAPHSVQVGQDYVLELAVKDQLLNVLIDGEFKMAYNLPKRKAGKISLWAFSATAEFDQLDLTTLPAETKLVRATGGSATTPKVLTRKDLQLALKVAEASEKVAVAHRLSALSGAASLEARTTAETVKYDLAQGDVKALAAAAGRASRQNAANQFAEQIAQAELKIEQARQEQETAPEPVRAKAAAKLKDAEKQQADLGKKFAAANGQLENGSDQYEVLGPQYPKTSSGRRLAFARWITDRKNPLAARVLVNHVWLRHFGEPLLERTFDFGLRSKKPQQAELLDWLAVQFMEDDWSLKKLHKRILMSGIYRRSSSSASASAATRSADPDNQALWRMNARRMEAEVVRDSVLALGNSLDLTMGGPPVEHTQGQAVPRRSLYFRQDKERQMTFLNLFDGAKVNECYERKSTVSPQQALALFNSPIAAGQARKITEAYASEVPGDFVKSLFEHVLCRESTPEEQAECTQFLAELKDSPEARRKLALVVLNHNDFVTIR